MKPGVEKTGAVAAGVSSARFHRNWKPGFDRLCLEIFGSVRTEDVRCASLWLVVHTPPPRPCARAAPGATRLETKIQTERRRRLLITKTPLLGSRSGSVSTSAISSARYSA